MAVIYVARSKSLSDWGASVGISKHLFKVGIAGGSGKEAVAALNAEVCAGVSDWKLVKAEDAGELDEAEALERLGKVETPVEPDYYPHIKGATSIFRVKPEKVENRLIIDKALAGEESLSFKIKLPDFAIYLIRIAQG